MKPKQLKTIAIAEAKDQLTALLRDEREPIILTRHGEPAGALVPFADADDYFDFVVERDPRFRRRIEASLKQAAEGKVHKLSEIKKMFEIE
jgi:prevent-host-death family protein